MENFLDLQELLDEVGAQNNFLTVNYSFFEKTSDILVQTFKESALCFFKIHLISEDCILSFIKKNGSPPELIDNAKVIAFYWSDCLHSSGYTKNGKLLFRPLKSLNISTVSGLKTSSRYLNKIINFIDSNCYELTGERKSGFSSQKSILKFARDNCLEAAMLKDEDLRRLIVWINQKAETQ